MDTKTVTKKAVLGFTVFCMVLSQIIPVGWSTVTAQDTLNGTGAPTYTSTVPATGTTTPPPPNVTQPNAPQSLAPTSALSAVTSQAVVPPPAVIPATVLQNWSKVPAPIQKYFQQLWDLGYKATVLSVIKTMPPKYFIQVDDNRQSISIVAPSSGLKRANMVLSVDTAGSVLVDPLSIIATYYAPNRGVVTVDNKTTGDLFHQGLKQMPEHVLIGIAKVNVTSVDVNNKMITLTYQNSQYKIYRETAGKVTIDPVMPALVTNYINQIKGVMQGFRVTYECVGKFPPVYAIHVVNATVAAGRFHKMDLKVSKDGVFDPASLAVSYYAADGKELKIQDTAMLYDVMDDLLRMELPAGMMVAGQPSSTDLLKKMTQIAVLKIVNNEVYLVSKDILYKVFRSSTDNKPVLAKLPASQSEAQARALLLSQFPGIDQTLIRVVSVRLLTAQDLGDGTQLPAGFTGWHLVTLKLGETGPTLTYISGTNASNATTAIATRTTLNYIASLPVVKSETHARNLLLSQFPGMDQTLIHVVSRPLTAQDLGDGTQLPAGFIGWHFVTIRIGDSNLTFTYISGMNAKDPYARSMGIATKTTLNLVSVIQSYIQNLQTQLGNGFKVSSPVPQANGDFLISVIDSKVYASGVVAPKGTLASLSFKIDMNGNFKGLSEMTYYGFEKLVGSQLIFAGMKLLEELGTPEGKDLRALVRLSQISVSKVDADATIHFALNQISWKVYWDATGTNAILEREITMPDGTVLSILELSKQGMLNVVSTQVNSADRAAAIAAISALPAAAGFYRTHVWKDGVLQATQYECSPAKRDFSVAKPQAMYIPGDAMPNPGLVQVYAASSTTPFFESKMFFGQNGISLNVNSIENTQTTPPPVPVLAKTSNLNGNRYADVSFDTTGKVTQVVYYQYNWASLPQLFAPIGAMVFPSTLKHYDATNNLFREFSMGSQGPILSMTVYAAQGQLPEPKKIPAKVEVYTNAVPPVLHATLYYIVLNNQPQLTRMEYNNPAPMKHS